MALPRLPNVTLLTVTGVELDQAHAALLHCAACIDFGAVKMLSPQLPRTTHSKVDYVRVPPLDRIGYSRFIIQSLNAYVQTDHCLIVQSDGFIINAARWDDRFLEYDYVGAPWPKSVALMPPGSGQFLFGKNRVGNGGFSLRSKKLLEISSRIDFDALDFPLKSEDLVICHYLYEAMLAAGIRFAPVELAASFSIKSIGLYGQSLSSVFGFHGRHWLKALSAGGDAAARPEQAASSGYRVTINAPPAAPSARPPHSSKT